jgi:hypothetical protein
MSASEGSPVKGRRRFLKEAGAVVAAAPVVAALKAAEAATPTKKKTSAASKPKPAPAADPFSATHPDLSLFRNAEERAMLETQWKAMQGALEAIRKAPLDPATEPVTVFAAMPRTRTKES